MILLGMDNVRHVPSLRNYLISIGQLAKDSYVTTFTDDTWKTSKGVMTVSRGKKKRTLYMTSNGCGSITITELFSFLINSIVLINK